jgi:AcrR family transcriptional regulator
MAERQADRRRRLIDAGIALVAGGGGRAVTVRAICREAGLTSRYFYEQFSDRDEFVIAVFHSVADECQTAIQDAVSVATTAHEVAGSAVAAVIRLALDQPDKGRVLFVAANSDPLLFATRNESLPVVGEMIAAQIPRREGDASRALKSASLVGALSHDLNLYIDGKLDVPREVFVKHCVDLLVAVAAI